MPAAKAKAHGIFLLSDFEYHLGVKQPIVHVEFVRAQADNNQKQKKDNSEASKLTYKQVNKECVYYILCTNVQYCTILRADGWHPSL